MGRCLFGYSPSPFAPAQAPLLPHLLPPARLRGVGVRVLRWDLAGPSAGTTASGRVAALKIRVGWAGI